MIYALVVVGLLQLMSLGMLSLLINQSARRDEDQRGAVAYLTASIVEMAGEPRAARIVERQSAPETEERREHLRPARPVPYGLRAR